jgi:hypothetical protein
MKIDRIVERIEQLRAQQQRLEARERGRERRRRTHAAIVAGSVLLTRPEAFGLSSEMVEEVLAQFVTREHDRRALRLPVAGADDDQPAPPSSTP